MSQIELSTFIQSVLIDIANGVRSANEQLRNPEKQQYDVFCIRHNKGDSAKIPGIKFDVAVTAGTQQKDKAGFFVALVNIGGGASVDKQFGNEIVHRIQFEVGIDSEWR